MNFLDTCSKATRAYQIVIAEYYAGNYGVIRVPPSVAKGCIMNFLDTCSKATREYQIVIAEYYAGNYGVIRVPAKIREK